MPNLEKLFAGAINRDHHCPDWCKLLTATTPFDLTMRFVLSDGIGIASLSSTCYRIAKAGHITWGGRDLERLPVQTVRRSIAVVQQNPVLFDGTIRDNIRYVL